MQNVRPRFSSRWSPVGSRECALIHSFRYTEEGVLSVPAMGAIPLFKGCLSICRIGILLGETRPEFVF